jgi:hypothetical protein
MKLTVHLHEPFVEGLHYRELSAREGGGRYRFALLEDVQFVHPHFILPLDANVSFRDRHGQEWMRLTCRTQTIRRHYWWNGNTPKWGFQLFGRSIWIGTWDHPATRPASNKHDADFQFSACEHYPFSWEAANQHYHDIARAEGFRLASAFHGALQDFSLNAWGRDHGCHSVQL